MELSAVLKFFGVTSESSVSELNTAYRAYVKRYRPENNPDREVWANNMLAKLNQAYETALEHLTESEKNRRLRIAAADRPKGRTTEEAEGGKSSSSTKSRATRESRSDRVDESRHRREERARDFAADLFAANATEAQRRYTFFNAFYEAVDGALEGMYLYYQYGLQNVHLRHEGVRSLRYRTALRKVGEATERLEQIKPYAKSSNDLDNILIFTEFATAFLHTMKIEKIHNPAGRPTDVAAYNLYHRASEGLDRAIRDVFFEELRESGPSAASEDNLELCSREFMIVLTTHLDSVWVTEAAIKVFLLEVFTKLVRRSSALSSL